MEAQVRRWGNSLAVRIPQAFARELRLEAGRTVELTLSEGRIVVTLARDDYELDQLLVGITSENRHAETDWGEPAGAEAW